MTDCSSSSHVSECSRNARSLPYLFPESYSHKSVWMSSLENARRDGSLLVAVKLIPHHGMLWINNDLITVLQSASRNIPPIAVNCERGIPTMTLKGGRLTDTSVTVIIQKFIFVSYISFTPSSADVSTWLNLTGFIKGWRDTVK